MTLSLGRAARSSPAGAVDAQSGTSDRTRLRRVVTLPWLVLYGLGSTVGAGIYVLTGAVAGRAGFHAPLAFLVAAALALFTALSFAEFSARFPRAGGALVYVKEALGSSALSVAVGLMTMSAGVISAATVSLGFVYYLGEIWAIPNVFALVVMVGSLGAIAAGGVRESVMAAGALTLIEVAGLVAIVAFGGAHLLSHPVDWSAAITTDVDAASLVPIGSAAVLCFYAFLGFEDIVNVAEEVREVRRAMPRAILWTLGLSALLYFAVMSVAVLVVPPEELARAEAPLALVFARSGGNASLLALIALAAMVNGALVQIVMASRILFSLSREGPLPALLGRVHATTRTPVAATLVVTLGVGLLAAAFPLESLAAATANIALLVFALVNVSLAVLLRRERLQDGNGDPGGHRPAIWVPAVGAAASIGFLALDWIGGFAFLPEIH